MYVTHISKEPVIQSTLYYIVSLFGPTEKFSVEFDNNSIINEFGINSELRSHGLALWLYGSVD